ncbi:hypothetical protein [Streptomyces bungoensis]|nr:hypothetical protein [Streptomyces bungoensis]
MEASAAPAAALQTAVAPSFQPGNHHAYGYRHFDDWRRYCDDDRYGRWGHRNHCDGWGRYCDDDRYGRWGHRNHCRDDRNYGWDQYRYGYHHRVSYWDCD